MWRVQAAWRVDDVPHSYAPLLVNSETEALQLAAEMQSDLAHFLGVEVTVREVSATDVDAERSALSMESPADQGRTIHLLDNSTQGTVCGSPIDGANSALDADLWALSVGDKCRTCWALRSHA